MNEKRPEYISFRSKKIRKVIKTAPLAMEKITWSMPTSWQGANESALLFLYQFPLYRYTDKAGKIFGAQFGVDVIDHHFNGIY